MKKILSLLLGAVMISALFVGCSSSSVQTAATSAVVSSETTSQENSTQQTQDEAVMAAYTTSLDDIKEKGYLVIGLDDTFAPMGFRNEAGELVGFDIDLAKAVCEVLGVEAKFQSIDWNAKELELNSGNIDCIWNGMSVTAERQQSMSLTNAYLNNVISVMTAQDVHVRSAQELVGLNIGIQAGSAALEAVKASSVYDSIKDNITEYPTYDEVILDMQAGRLECMIIDEVYGSYKNAQLNNIFNTSPVDFGDDLYAVGFRKADMELCSAVDAAIDELVQNGTAAEISTTWFGTDIVLR